MNIRPVLLILFFIAFISSSASGASGIVEVSVNLASGLVLKGIDYGYYKAIQVAPLYGFSLKSQNDVTTSEFLDPSIDEQVIHFNWKELKEVRRNQWLKKDQKADNFNRNDDQMFELVSLQRDPCMPPLKSSIPIKKIVSITYDFKNSKGMGEKLKEGYSIDHFLKKCTNFIEAPASNPDDNSISWLVLDSKNKESDKQGNATLVWAILKQMPIGEGLELYWLSDRTSPLKFDFPFEMGELNSEMKQLRAVIEKAQKAWKKEVTQREEETQSAGNLQMVFSRLELYTENNLRHIDNEIKLKHISEFDFPMVSLYNDDLEYLSPEGKKQFDVINQKVMDVIAEQRSFINQFHTKLKSKTLSPKVVAQEKELQEEKIKLLAELLSIFDKQRFEKDSSITSNAEVLNRSTEAIKSDLLFAQEELKKPMPPYADQKARNNTFMILSGENARNNGDRMGVINNRLRNIPNEQFNVINLYALELMAEAVKSIHQLTPQKRALISQILSILQQDKVLTLKLLNEKNQLKSATLKAESSRAKEDFSRLLPRVLPKLEKIVKAWIILQCHDESILICQDYRP